MKNILVTGGTGFVGTSICQFLIKKGYYVVSFDNGSRKNRKNEFLKNKNIKFFNGNILNKKDLFKIKIKFDAIIHLAFINGTKFFYEKPDEIINVGVIGMLNIMEFAKKRNIKEFYLASSSEVYQTPLKIPTDEKEPMKVPNPYNPRYSYGGSKIMSELIAINFGKLFLKKLVIFRPHNVYGPNMGNEHVIPEIIKKISDAKKNGAEFITIQGSGQETRTFNYIDDFTQGIGILIDKAKKFNTFNIGDQKEVSIRYLVEKIMNLMKVKLKIQTTNLTKGSTLRRKPNISKIKKLGYRPSTTLSAGLQKTISWYLKN
tara:strand:- start:1276 stop:2223 length:948 start_codon:yes stop_codon:yes gene_type:complete